MNQTNRPSFPPGLQPPAAGARPGVQPKPPRPNRMGLAAIQRGRKRAPMRIAIYGVDKVGKTTFAANAPAPVIIGPEDGVGNLDVPRFPVESWLDTRDAIATLINEEHDFQTLAIDSLDWLEPMCWAHVCEEAGQPNIEAFGYGKGYVAALDAWRTLIADLERLRAKRGMHVVLIAHAQLKTFKNPAGEDFDRYSMKLHEKTAGLFKEWVDALLFASHEIIAAKDQKTKRVRGVDTGARLLHTVHRAAWDAGNRYSLPDPIPLSWEDFAAAVEAGQVAEPAAILAAIEAKLAELGDEAFAATVRAFIATIPNNGPKLAECLNRVSARVASKENAQ